MIFRKPPKRRPESFRGETPLMRIIRYLLILALFGAALWGLWENNNRRQARMRTDAGPAAVEPGLAPAERAKVAEYVERFRKEYGVPLVVEVRSEPPEQNSLDALAGVLTEGDDPQRVVLVLCPQSRQSFFLAPAAVREALGDDAKSLAGPLFVPYFASGDWRSGLRDALHRIAVRLDAAFSTPE